MHAMTTTNDTPQPAGRETFVLFTHSKWHEPPRIRHQVTNLLLAAGHEVIYFERGGFGRHVPSVKSERERLKLVASKKLVHTQMRVLPLLHDLNRRFIVPQLRAYRDSGLFGPSPRIINFNFDFYFLRELFPETPLLTVINDDFEAQSRLPFHGHITWALKRTCQSSDRVLALSESLRRRLAPWCPDTQIYLPWAVTPYRAPATPVAERDTLLFWGSVDTAIDLGVLSNLAGEVARLRPNWKIVLAGPPGKAFAKDLAAVTARFSNISVQGATPLDELPIERTVAAIIPYRRHPAQDAIMLANKSFQLFARGLPVVISGMPDFLKLPFVRRLDEGRPVGEVLDEVVAKFDAWQPEIAAFVGANPPESRVPPLFVERVRRA
jgi:hypothetical protein